MPNETLWRDDGEIVLEMYPDKYGRRSYINLRARSQEHGVRKEEEYVYYVYPMPEEQQR